MGPSTVFILILPGKEEPGTIVVRCPKISQGQPSLLRGMGRIQPDSLPAECEIEMDGGVLYEGQGALSGKEAFLSITQSSMTVRTNQDPLPGQYVFRPPALKVVLPSGRERRSPWGDPNGLGGRSWRAECIRIRFPGEFGAGGLVLGSRAWQILESAETASQRQADFPGPQPRCDSPRRPR